MLDVIKDTLTDGLKLLPFLFLTYLAMEFLEHRTGGKTQRIVGKAGKLGPLLGGILGAAPQCGFSAAASNLYAGRIITLGTLLAIYLSTSDEMLPILISEQAPVRLIASILLGKVAIGAAAGFAVDFMFRKRDGQVHIHDICEQEHCHCEEGIFRSAVNHTLKITAFILIVTFLLNLVMYLVGENALAGLMSDRPVFGPVLAGLVGLIPNCAASVVITQLYLQGALGAGAMMSGLLVGSGVGLAVLFRVNHNRRENLIVVALLYVTGVLAGILIELAV